MYIDGGISRQEIRILKNYSNKDTKEKYEVIVGGDDILSPKDYVAKYVMKSN